MQSWGIVFVAITYLLFLFVVASYGDRRLSRGAQFNQDSQRLHRMRAVIYALSLAIYCTSWTFFGSVGLASTSGLDFLAIYVGPILMVTLGYPLFRHIIAVAKKERITSIADFIASRYGKSASVGAFAAVIAVLGTVPYIALQLKAISTSVDIMIQQLQPSVIEIQSIPLDTPFFVSVMLALFTILFGTRHTDATEHQDGLILAVATESIIKLVAFLAIGIFATYVLFSGPADLALQAQQSSFVSSNFIGGIHPTRFLVFTLLSFGAFVLLPRQFHVGVVENHSEQEIKAARWMFPLYLVLINLFVIPVAIAGMLIFGNNVDADTYVLALPLENDALWLSHLVFVGGLSAATAMVIVACVALAIMISNNLVLPLLLRLEDNRQISGGRLPANMSNKLLAIRRSAIFIVVALAYIYFQLAGNSAALASIGLLSFAAVAQFAPAFFIGFFWRRPTSTGTLWGMGVGFATWIYTLFVPTLLDPSSALLSQGPLGIEWLRPQGLFGIEAEPLNHGVFFSLLFNTLAYVVVSYWRRPKAIESMQASVFSIRGKGNELLQERDGRTITVAELKHVVSNYLGRERAERAFKSYFEKRGQAPDNRELAGNKLVAFAEQVLASAIGAASSRLVISLLLQKHAPTEHTTMQLLDDASEALQYNRDLLQTALDQVDQGISVFDKDFKLTSWNRQFRGLLELPPELGQAGTSLSTICNTIEAHSELLPVGTPNRTSSSHDELIVNVLETRETSTIALKPSGRIVEIQTNTLPHGGVVISWSDVTEKTTAARALTTANETLERRVQERTEELTRLNADLAKAREAADDANIGKTRFLAAVGHDILQPLNAARLYSTSLSEELEGGKNQGLAENVGHALESVEDILGAVLAISRLDAGALTPNVTIFSVASLFDRLDVEFTPIAKAKNLKLKILSSNLSVKSDYNLLRRLLQNLISNAIKYTPVGTVTLDARVKRNRVIFEVEDTGVGIRESDHEIIFQEFYRLEEGKLAAQGLGLGLSIVKRIASTLDHPIAIHTSPGKGSVFTVSVPFAVEKQKPSKTTEPQRAPKQELKDLVVVCIDNDETILDGMELLLRRWNCKVHIYKSSSNLLSEVEEVQPDIILADYHLDEENGLDVISAARSKLQTSTSAVLITADRSADVRKIAAERDVTVMNKPLKPAALRAFFASIAGQKQQKTSPTAAE